MSWLVLRGRCRYCHEPIGLFHLAIESAAVAVAVWSATVFSGSLLWVSCCLGWALLALAGIDLKYYLLPDFLTLPLIFAGLLVHSQLDASALAGHVIGSIAGYVFVVVLRSLYRRVRGQEGMGLGDAKLLAASGAWVSWAGLPSVILLGASAGLIFALLKGTADRAFSLATRVPFGAFLCLGTWIIWLYGPLTLG